MNNRDRAGLSFLGLLALTLLIAAGAYTIAEAQCSGGSGDTCAYLVPNPCAACSTCCPFPSGWSNNYTCTTNSWPGVYPSYFNTVGNPAQDWYGCRTGTQGSCSRYQAVCENINTYVASPCSMGSFCYYGKVDACNAATNNVCP